MTISYLADQFLSFYKSKGAEVLASAPLIHPLFPMSFNMSAGLVQLDPLLRSSDIVQDKKMVVVQKCFRHFDVAKVTDFFHLSFFEMGGFFEVGILNKKRAITNIFELLVKIFEIDTSRLWVTTFSGDDIFGLRFPKDKEMSDLWKELLPNKDQIISFGKEHNFWTQGGGTEIAIESKLCGSQTEIFYDLGYKKCKKNPCLPNCECGRFLEISNNLFITHKITGDLKVLPLPNKAIESVIGIERVCAVIENKDTVFEIEDIDCLTRLIKSEQQNTDENKIRKGRIVDHLRALSFLIPEGAPMPGRNGRARIIRTLIRELLTDIYVLNLKSSEMIKLLISKIIAMYQDRYPYLSGKQNQIFEFISDHEQIYLKTLHKAGGVIQRYLKKNNKTELNESDKEYFRKQFGIPVELQNRSINL